MSIVADYLIPFGTLAVTTLCAGVAWHRGDKVLRRSAAAMALNLGLTFAASLFVPWQHVWLAWLGIDGLTAYIILKQPAGKVQATLGFLYLVQCTFHVAFYLNGSPVEALGLYQDMLTGVLGGQVLTLIGGTFHDDISRCWSAACHWGTDYFHGPKGMGGKR